MALGPIGPRAYWPWGLLALGPIGPWGLLAPGPIGPKLFHLAECAALQLLTSQKRLLLTTERNPAYCENMTRLSPSLVLKAGNLDVMFLDDHDITLAGQRIPLNEITLGQ